MKPRNEKKTLAVLARKVMWQLILNHGNKYKMTVFSTSVEKIAVTEMFSLFSGVSLSVIPVCLTIQSVLSARFMHADD